MFRIIPSYRYVVCKRPKESIRAFFITAAVIQDKKQSQQIPLTYPEILIDQTRRPPYNTK
jgi:hypothetical protein